MSSELKKKEVIVIFDNILGILRVLPKGGNVFLLKEIILHYSLILYVLQSCNKLITTSNFLLFTEYADI